MMNAKHDHTISGVFVFFLLGVFAVSATLMVLLGAQAYKGGADRAEAHNAGRIASAYLRGMLREADEMGQLRAEELDGAGALKITNAADETVTLLFVRDGHLWEWYTFQSLYDETKFDPATGAPLYGAGEGGEEVRGEIVCALDEMNVSLDGHLLTVRLRSGDSWTDVNVALRCAPQ